MIAVNVLKTTGFLHVDVVNEVKMIDIVVDLVKETRVVGLLAVQLVKITGWLIAVYIR